MTAAAMVLVPSVGQLKIFLDQEDLPFEQATVHLSAVTAMAESYTRGNGFTWGNGEIQVARDIAAVIMTATARLIDNPEQYRSYALGAETTGFTPFLGWSLAETAVLNRYRKRAM